MSETWNTKYGGRRVRHDPPTLQEAMAAAQGLTDQLNEQIEIAASLMDLPVAEVRSEIIKTTSHHRKVAEVIAPSSRREGATRTVVVERRVSRRIAVQKA